MTSGFVEIADKVVLEGIVMGKSADEGYPPSLASDDDWCHNTGSQSWLLRHPSF